AVAVTSASDRLPARAVVSSVPWYAFRSIWPGGEAPRVLQDVAEAAEATESSPIVTVNLWFDGPVMDEPFIGLVDAPIHWVFNNAAIVGEQASHLAVVTTAAHALASASNDAVASTTIELLRAVLPRIRERTLVRSVVVRAHRATFSVAPGAPARPGATTGVSGLFLAGDWIDTGLPATIEGAAESGRIAADLAMAFVRQS